MIRSKRQLTQFLSDRGYSLSGGSKHEKWSKPNHTVFIPRHSKGFSIYLAQRIQKEVLTKTKTEV